MPIYEFKCVKCNNFTEVILINSKEHIELKCNTCGSKNLERIISSTNHSISGNKNSKKSFASVNNRTCSSGSCTTYNIPGPA